MELAHPHEVTVSIRLNQIYMKRTFVTELNGELSYRQNISPNRNAMSSNNSKTYQENANRHTLYA